MLAKIAPLSYKTLIKNTYDLRAKLMVAKTEKVQLSGFNNLTKILSFNLYDFNIAMNDQQRQEYIEYIHNKYSAAKIRDIAREICRIIEANILNESIQDYEPVGASTMTLMSDVKGGKWETGEQGAAAVKMHLDKSHICTHTYPDASDPEGICTFRVDIDVATCGEIIPLRALEYMFNAFESDVVYIDYVVRGYTRLDNGKKIYNDHYFNSIQDFIPKEILDRYVYRQDINMAHDNTWQTKMMIKQMGPENYLLDPKDANHRDIDKKMALLQQEMREVFHLN
ncbi:MAG: adenosylmethionine decarboxylase [Proteobacteria bacterium]|nr:adenosylmethionine decarboxylase [Pseudomonadota bacterium]